MRYIDWAQTNAGAEFKTKAARMDPKRVCILWKYSICLNQKNHPCQAAPYISWQSRVILLTPPLGGGTRAEQFVRNCTPATPIYRPQFAGRRDVTPSGVNREGEPEGRGDRSEHIVTRLGPSIMTLKAGIVFVRTTLTLNDDLAAELTRTARFSARSFNEVVNRAIR